VGRPAKKALELEVTFIVSAAMREWPSNAAYEQAMARSGAGEHAAALRLFAKALAAQPDRPRIHSNRARALVALERFDEARTAADRGRALADPDDPYPLQVVAQIMDRTGDSDGAVRVIDEALARTGCKDLDRVNLRVCRAWALVHGERYREAISDAREAARIDPERSDVQLILARALAAAYRWGEGMRIVQAVLATAPADEDALELRDTIARGLAIAEDMVATARAELSKRRKSTESWLNLGMALTMAGRLVEAAEAFDRAHEHNPEPDPWPREPHMLSVWEADCRLALMMDGIAKASKAKKKRAPKKSTNKRRRQRGS
jgi:tetratricopeptide (TPR) repeat protein